MDMLRAVVVSVDTLTATDSVEAAAADEAWVTVVVSVVVQPDSATTAHSTPSATTCLSMQIIPTSSFSNINPPENEFYGRVLGF